MGWNTVVTNIYPDTSSFEEKMIAIEAVNLIKEKICGKIQGRNCADDSKKGILNKYRVSHCPQYIWRQYSAH